MGVPGGIACGCRRHVHGIDALKLYNPRSTDALHLLFGQEIYHEMKAIATVTLINAAIRPKDDSLRPPPDVAGFRLATTRSHASLILEKASLDLLSMHPVLSE